MSKPTDAAHERERRTIAALIHPNTRNAARKAATGAGLESGHFADTDLGDLFRSIVAGMCDHKNSVRAVLSQVGANPSADIAADCAAIIADYEARTPGSLKNVTAKLNGCGITFVDADDFVRQELAPPDWIIPDLIARGMKCDIYGKSKMRKSYFAQQFAQCVAAGRRFLKWDIPQPRRVVYFNLELMPYFQQERMRTQRRGLEIGAGIHGNLRICNLRGNAAILRDHADELVAYFKATDTALVIIDPRYKLMKRDEDENKADGLRGILDFRDRILEASACIMVTHDPKGDAGGKSISDRGAGSYTAGADCDYSLALSEHERGDGYIVVEDENRNRKRLAPFTAVFDDERHIFTADDEIPAVKATPQGKRKAKTETDADKVRKYQEAQISMKLCLERFLAKRGENFPSATELKEELCKTFPKSKVEDFIKQCKGNGTLVPHPQMRLDEKTGKWRTVAPKEGGKTYLSSPERIEAYKRKVSQLPI